MPVGKCRGGRKRMLVPLPFDIARFAALFLQFAPGGLKATIRFRLRPVREEALA